MNAYVPCTQPESVYEWFGWTPIACVHWALSELLAAADRARAPLWTGDATTESSGEQDHGDRVPLSKPPLASGPPGGGVAVVVGVGVGRGVAVGVGVGRGVAVGVAVGVGVRVGVGVGVCPPPPG